jgi:serine/threonine protein kinase
MRKVNFHVSFDDFHQPGDILITRKGGIELKICDFGLARKALGSGVDQRFGEKE